MVIQHTLTLPQTTLYGRRIRTSVVISVYKEIFLEQKNKTTHLDNPKLLHHVKLPKALFCSTPLRRQPPFDSRNAHKTLYKMMCPLSILNAKNCSHVLLYQHPMYETSCISLQSNIHFTTISLKWTVLPIFKVVYFYEHCNSRTCRSTGYSAICCTTTNYFRM